MVEAALNTPRLPLAVTADKAYDSQKVRQQIKDEGALPVIPSRSNAVKKPIAPSAFIASGTRLRTSFVASKTGGASLPATTNWPETFTLP
jgi:hypothetical protein